MISVIQRVRYAQVSVGDSIVGQIDQGILALVAIEKNDNEHHVARMAQRLLGYRMFADEQGKMNRSVKDIDGGVLLVSQFTLAADTQKGMRPNFSSAASPEHGLTMYQSLVNAVQQQNNKTACGQFGADMQIELLNDGPVTFVLNS